MLPKLADDAAAAKAVGGDRCYLSSPAASSQIAPRNKAINLIDQHISFIATLMLQLEDGVSRFSCENDGKQTPVRPVLQSKLLPAFVLAYEYFILVMSFSAVLLTLLTLAGSALCILFLRLPPECNCVLFFGHNTGISLSVRLCRRHWGGDKGGDWLTCPSSAAFPKLCCLTCRDSSPVSDTLFCCFRLTRSGSYFRAFVHVEQNSCVEKNF